MRAAAPSAPQGNTTIDRLLIGLVLAIGVYAADDLALSTVLPAVAADLAGDRLYGASFVAFLLTNLASLVATGYFIDRFGVARPFAVGMALFGAGLVLGCAALSMPAFVLGRGLQGLGGGALQAVVSATLTLAWSGAARQRAISWVTTGWMVPALLGPGAAGWIAQVRDWRHVFGALVLLSALTTVLVLPRLRRVQGGATAVADDTNLIAPLPLPGAVVRDALIIALAMGGVVAGLTRADVPGCALAAASLVAGWPALAASLPQHFWCAGSPLAAVLLLRLLACAVFFGIEAWLPWVARRSDLATPVVAGLVLSAAAGGWTAATWWVDAAIARRGAPAILALASALLLGGTALTWYALIEARSLTLLFAAWSVAGAAMGMIYPVVSMLAMARAEPGREGRLSMMLGLADTLGITCSIGLGGAWLRAEQAGALGRVGPLWLGLVMLTLLLPLLLITRRRYFVASC